MPYLNVTEVESALSVAANPPNAAFSQLITLYVTPVVYTYMDTASEKAGHFFSRFGRKDEHHAPVPAAGGLDGRVVVTSSGDAAD